MGWRSLGSLDLVIIYDCELAVSADPCRNCLCDTENPRALQKSSYCFSLSLRVPLASPKLGGPRAEWAGKLNESLRLGY